MARLDFAPEHRQPSMPRLLLASLASIAGSLPADAVGVQRAGAGKCTASAPHAQRCGSGRVPESLSRFRPGFSAAVVQAG